MFTLRDMVIVWKMALRNKECGYAYQTRKAMEDWFEFEPEEIERVAKSYRKEWDSELDEAQLDIIREDKAFYYGLD